MSFVFVQTTVSKGNCVRVIAIYLQITFYATLFNLLQFRNRVAWKSESRFLSSDTHTFKTPFLPLYRLRFIRDSRDAKIASFARRVFFWDYIRNLFGNRNILQNFIPSLDTLYVFSVIKFYSFNKYTLKSEILKETTAN